MPQPVPEQQTLTGPVIHAVVEELGRIDIAGRTASVSWPGGDAVGLDFTEGRSRFGVVVGLDGDPRLRVEPDHADLLDVEERLVILEQVGALWYQAVAGPKIAAWSQLGPDTVIAAVGE